MKAQHLITEIDLQQWTDAYGDLEIVTAQAPAEVASGVYFLVDGLELIYVGQSLNLNERLVAQWYAMRRDARPQFTGYACQLCPPEILDDLELHYIQTLHPRDNRLRDRVAFRKHGRRKCF